MQLPKQPAAPSSDRKDPAVLSSDKMDRRSRSSSSSSRSRKWGYDGTAITDWSGYTSTYSGGGRISHTSSQTNPNPPARPTREELLRKLGLKDSHDIISAPQPTTETLDTGQACAPPQVPLRRRRKKSRSHSRSRRRSAEAPLPPIDAEMLALKAHYEASLSSDSSPEDVRKCIAKTRYVLGQSDLESGEVSPVSKDVVLQHTIRKCPAFESLPQRCAEEVHQEDSGEVVRGSCELSSEAPLTSPYVPGGQIPYERREGSIDSGISGFLSKKLRGDFGAPTSEDVGLSSGKEDIPQSQTKKTIPESMSGMSHPQATLRSRHPAPAKSSQATVPSTDDVLIESAPVRVDAVQIASVKSVPAKTASPKATLVETIPVKAIPAKNQTAEATPVKSSPVNVAPISVVQATIKATQTKLPTFKAVPTMTTTPVKAIQTKIGSGTLHPVENIATSVAHGKPLHTKALPVRSLPMRTSPVKTAPIKAALVKTISVKNIPCNTLPVETLSRKGTFAQDPLNSISPIPSSTVETLPVKTVLHHAKSRSISPVKTTFVSGVPSKSLPVKSIPVRTGVVRPPQIKTTAAAIPFKADPAGTVPKEADPTEAASMTDSVVPTPTKTTPIEIGTIEIIPVVIAQTKLVPVRVTQFKPVESLPKTPGDATPLEVNSNQDSSNVIASVRTDSVATTPIKTIPSKIGAIRIVPVILTPTKIIPVKIPQLEPSSFRPAKTLHDAAPLEIKAHQDSSPVMTPLRTIPISVTTTKATPIDIQSVKGTLTETSPCSSVKYERAMLGRRISSAELKASLITVKPRRGRKTFARPALEAIIEVPEYGTLGDDIRRYGSLDGMVIS